MVFIRLAAGNGSAGAALGAGMTSLDAFVNPGAARAREELEHQNERVVPAPSPGDLLLREGRITIALTEPA
jgi:hypothetical protein